MPTGTVIWFSTIKGYGFIKPDNSNEEVFVHATALIKASIPKLSQGQRINYEFDTLKGKKIATNLQILATS